MPPLRSCAWAARPSINTASGRLCQYLRGISLRIIASFNRGYRSFESTYTKCTASATEAISRYTVEGENLARDLAARYGN